MIKQLIILILLTNFTVAKVKVTSIADYMLNHTNNEGASGPGFFINTHEFIQVSKIMKEKLGINDITKLPHMHNQSNPYQNKKNTNNITKEKKHKNQTFQDKLKSLKTDNQYTYTSNNKSFSEVITNHKIKITKKESIFAFK